MVLINGSNLSFQFLINLSITTSFSVTLHRSLKLGKVAFNLPIPNLSISNFELVNWVV